MDPIESIQTEPACEDPELIIPKKRSRFSKEKKNKRSNSNRSNIKREDDTQKMPAKTKPQDDNIHIIIKKFVESESVKDRSFHNAVTIVENSYACPFNSLYNTYHCVYCRKKFIDPDDLRAHNLTHDPKLYRDILKVIRHRNSKCQIDFQRIDCRLCDQKINEYDSFTTHLSQVHGKKIHSKTSVQADKDFILLMFRLTNTELKCLECEKEFPNFRALKLHTAEHFGTCVCEICGIHYFEERMLKAHLKSHEPTQAIYTCAQCGKTFKSKYNMTIHVARFHTKEAVYFCTLCDDSFFSKTLRQKHMVHVHNDETLFKCTSCDKVYDNRKQLVNHNKRQHLKIFKHPCPVCEKKFFTPGHLREHMYSHNGERNFRCDLCGKSYPRLKSLRVHMQVHTPDKKYKCSMCNASFSQNVCLKNHVKRQHQNVEMDESYQASLTNIRVQ